MVFSSNTKPAFNGNSQDFVAQKSNTDSISIFVNFNQTFIIIFGRCDRTVHSLYTYKELNYEKGFKIYSKNNIISHYISFFGLLVTRYMENKLPVYRSLVPDNRNFCSRLYLKYNEINYKDALDFSDDTFNKVKKYLTITKL